MKYYRFTLSPEHKTAVEYRGVKVADKPQFVETTRTLDVDDLASKGIWAKEFDEKPVAGPGFTEIKWHELGAS